MPDTPRTVREWMDGLNVADGIPLAGYFPDAFLGALIGAQGRVVYTAEDVERAAVAAVAAASGLDETGAEWDELMEGMWNESYDEAVERFKKVARAAITAAGGVVADESTKIVSNRVVVELTRVISSDDSDDATTCTELHRGDKLYIVRAKEE